jgi:hypothetical protein
MYQFLDEMDMWSLLEKNPKETGVLEKHNTKGKFMRIKKNSKKSCFSQSQQ